MKFIQILTCLLGAATVSAQPVNQQSERAVGVTLLDILQQAHTQISNDTAIILSSMAQMTAGSTKEQNATSIDRATGALKNTIATITQAGAQVASAQRNATPSPASVPLVMRSASGIVAEIITAILAVINNSSILQALAGDLINAVLGLIDALGKALIGIPGIQLFLYALGELLKYIPT